MALPVQELQPIFFKSSKQNMEVHVGLVMRSRMRWMQATTVTFWPK